MIMNQLKNGLKTMMIGFRNGYFFCIYIDIIYSKLKNSKMVLNLDLVNDTIFFNQPCIHKKSHIEHFSPNLQKNKIFIKQIDILNSFLTKHFDTKCCCNFIFILLFTYHKEFTWKNIHFNLIKWFNENESVRKKILTSLKNENKKTNFKNLKFPIVKILLTSNINPEESDELYKSIIENVQILEECRHEWESLQVQIRTNDEMESIIKSCKLCKITYHQNQQIDTDKI